MCDFACLFINFFAVVGYLGLFGLLLNRLQFRLLLVVKAILKTIQVCGLSSWVFMTDFKSFNKYVPLGPIRLETYMLKPVTTI